MSTALPIDVRPVVAEAILAGRPVVALETTVMTHGLPRPAGLDSARDCEEIVREAGAVPATVGVMRGRLVVGLHNEELAELANSNESVKVNLGNIAAAIVKGQYGGTSVSTTILAAHRAGIRVVATGGIGGVHRGFGETLDISSDLTAMQHASVVLVSAGAKSILDVAATREQLETRGIPVIGFQTDHFPLFFCGGSAIGVDCRADSPKEVAAIYRTHRSLGFPGTVLAVADPPAADALPHDVLEEAVRGALGEAERRGISGRALTPFILERVQRATEGASLRANLSLLRNNCQIAAEIARELAACG
ncbi:MAG: pseudouridylate synthase [Candidatus Sumerlaeota bacterium]|nr:pseudouridylate synthase [Candidatus Sumerlaeota bacterium]